jgi:hypothetical protein
LIRHTVHDGESSLSSPGDGDFLAIGGAIHGELEGAFQGGEDLPR